MSLAQDPPATPRGAKGARRPVISICNRCIPKVNEDLFAIHCNAVFGAFKKKCAHCASTRHACVEVELALYPALDECMRARAAHANAQRDEREDEDELRAAALAAGDDLAERLATLNRNRSNITGDRSAPRKRSAAAAFGASSNQDLVLEVQSLRRGILALVEVGKALLRAQMADQVVIDRIDLALGPDAPEDAFPGEEEEEEEEE